jgi:hypothetical protein
VWEGRRERGVEEGGGRREEENEAKKQGRGRDGGE